MTLVVPLAAAGTDPAGSGGADVSVVGGKGASLIELVRTGIAVPPGFVVTVEAFAAAMAAVDPSGARRAEIEALPAADPDAIAAAAARFRALVAGAALPAGVAAAIEAGYAGLAAAAGDSAGAPGGGSPGHGDPDVAVRSSATVEDSAEASFAGLQDTYLGVRGAAAVLAHVRRCWASLYNDESVAYRRRLGLPESGVAMAVVVQRMVAPRAAGVMFTRSPVTGDRSVVAIEAVWGLGSALVSGDVTPDSWAISKITGEITTRRVSPKAKIHQYGPNASVPSPPAPAGPAAAGEAPARAPAAAQPGGPALGGLVSVVDTPPELRDSPCLTDDEIRALAAVGRRVEAHYGAAQDIEWAVLDAPFAPAPEASAAEGSAEPAGSASAASAESRVVLLQSRPETVWAGRESKPAGAPRARAADHVLAAFGKQP